MLKTICVQSRHVACVGSLQVALNSSAATTAAPEDDEAAESCNRTCQQLIGIAFVLVGEVAVVSRAVNKASRRLKFHNLGEGHY